MRELPVDRLVRRRANGVPFPVDVTLRADGERFVCALREPTREELAAESMRHFGAAFESSPIGMALFNTDGEYVRVNAALCAMLGRTAEDLIGRRDQELTHPDDREAELRHLADHDPLTGLLNRRAFSLALEQHVCRVRRYGGDGALLMADLDGFKRVNDRLGHAAGDELLTACADALRSRLRDSDVIARLGGDEFAVLLPTGGREQAATVARGLVAAVARRAITVSVGVAPAGEGSSTADELMRAADRAMYRAKRAGGGAFASCD